MSVQLPTRKAENQQPTHSNHERLRTREEVLSRQGKLTRHGRIAEAVDVV